MPKKKNTKFKPGNKANPKGRPKTSKEMKAVRRLTRDKFQEVANKFLFLPVDQLHEMVEKKRGNMENMNVLEGMVAKVMSDGLKVGNISTLTFFLERLVTKARFEKFTQKVPTAPEMVSETMRAASIELARLQSKAAEDGLTGEETRSLVQLSKVVSEMVDHADKIVGDDPRSLSDEALVKQAKDAMKVLKENLSNETAH